jgi:hypothetical protein
MDAHVPQGERWRRRWSSIAGVLGTLAAAPAFAAMVPGGGPATSDCYAELEVAGVDPDTVQHGKKVVCRDGDPCDTGPCGDGVCDVVVRLCWNQHDPDLPACVPPASLDELHVRGPLRSLLVMPERMTLGSCTEPLSFPVPTTHGTTRITAKAPAGVTPLVDADTVRIVCMPRPFDECAVSTTTVPGATTTTTTGGPTATTSTSTTTTTLKGPPKKTTTTRKPTTTTTTSAPPVTTTVAPTTTTAPPPPTTLVVPTTTEPPTTEPPSTTTPTTTDTTTTTHHKHGDDDGIVIVISL